MLAKRINFNNSSKQNLFYGVSTYKMGKWINLLKKENYLCKVCCAYSCYFGKHPSSIYFLKGEYQAGGLLALGWLTIVIGEKRMFNGEKTNEES